MEIRPPSSGLDVVTKNLLMFSIKISCLLAKSGFLKTIRSGTIHSNDKVLTIKLFKLGLIYKLFSVSHINIPPPPTR